MGGARVSTLVTLRKCTLGHKREIKTLKFVSASTKGFKGGLAWIKPSKKDMAVTFSYSFPMSWHLTYDFTMSPDPKIQLPDYRRNRRGRDFPAAASIFGSFCEICANSVRCCRGNIYHKNTIYSMRMHQNLPFFMKKGPKMVVFWPKIEFF